MLKLQPTPRSFGFVRRDYRFLHILVGVLLLALAVAWILAPFSEGPSAFNIVAAVTAAVALCRYAVCRLRQARRNPRFKLRLSRAPLRRHRRLEIAGVVLGLCGLLAVISDHPGSAGVRDVDLMPGAALCGLALLAGAVALWGVRRARVPATGARLAMGAIALAVAGLIGLPLQ